MPRALESFFDVDARIQQESLRTEEDGHVDTRSPERPWWLLLVVSDVVAIALGIVVVTLVQGLGATPAWALVFGIVWVGALAMGGAYPGWGLGPVDRLRTRVRAVAAAVVIAWLGGIATTGIDFQSLTWIALAASVTAGAQWLGGIAVRHSMVNSGRWGLDAVFYGTEEATKRILQVVESQPAVGFRPVGIFDDDPRTWGRELHGIPVLGDTGLVHPDASVAVLALSSGDVLRADLDRFLRYYRRVVVVPELVEQSAALMQPVDFAGLLGLEMRLDLTSRVAKGAKRATDLFLTSVTLPLWGLVVMFAAALVWLGDRESPFYVQRRKGQHGRDIEVLKLRTMVPNAEAALKAALANDESLRIEWEATSKLQNDPRITRVGGIMRKLSIDELPQLVNVLRGDMSLVGPRPLPSYHENKLTEESRRLRRLVRPGMSGLWQVSGRSDTGDEGIAWLDSYYVRNWSVWLDVVIVLSTFRAAVRSAGAY